MRSPNTTELIGGPHDGSCDTFTNDWIIRMGDEAETVDGTIIIGTAIYVVHPVSGQAHYVASTGWGQRISRTYQEPEDPADWWKKGGDDE